VWKPATPLMGSDYWFKVKGEKHSVTHVKTLVEVDLQKMATVSDFAKAVCTTARLEQGLEHLKENNIALDRKSTGDYLRWLMNDVIKEELDRMKESNLEPKDIGKEVSTKARAWFFEQVDKVC